MCYFFRSFFSPFSSLNIDTMVLKHPSPWLVPLSPGSCRVWSTCQDQDAGDDSLGCTAQAVPVASGPTIDIMPWIIGMLDGLSGTSSRYCKSIRVHKKRAILQRYDKFVIGFKLFSEFVLEDFIFLLKVYSSIDFRSGGSLFSRYFDFSNSEPGLGRDRPRSLLFEKNSKHMIQDLMENYMVVLDSAIPTFQIDKSIVFHSVAMGMMFN